jgi:Ca2+-binding EF-hand superfamily protein
MKKSVRVLFVAAALASVSGVAAAGGDHARRAECRAAHDAKYLTVYDKNRDGQIDRAERQSLRRDRRQQAVARYDADRDGRLSEVEWTRLRRDRVAEKFAKLDVDRDGAISRQEAAAPCSRLARHFDKVDTDRDGRVSAAELTAARMFGKRGKFRHRHGQPPADDVEEGPGDPGADPQQE